MATSVTGYTPSTDQAANNSLYPLGYRSHKVARKATAGSNQYLEASDVSYNGFVFPPQLSARATVVQEYTKDQRTVKYLTIALTIECIISPYSATSYGPSTFEGNAVVQSFSDDMDTIRERLSQPCQILSFKLQGFGSFSIQGTPQHNSGTSSSVVYDVDYGPKPQVLDWEPLGGSICARIQWLITTRIPACGRTVGITGLTGVLDFSYAAAWSVDEAGFFNRQITGSIELARTRFPNQSGLHAATNVNLASAKTEWEVVTNAVSNAFPILGGFKRSESYKVSENKKVLSFTFNDVEIPSPVPFPTGVLDIAVSESLASSIQAGEGFQKWRWDFSGDVRVFNSKTAGRDVVYNKRLAFDAFYLILRDRLSRVKAAALRKKIKPGESPSGSNFTTETVISSYPTSISISNEVFGTGISFNISYILTCPPDLLMRTTGFMDAVRPPYNSTWDQWRDDLVSSGTRVVYPNILPNQDAIVDLCHPLVLPSSSRTSPKRNPGPANSKASVLSAEAPPEEASYLKYDNYFGTQTDYHTQAGVLLSPDAKEITPELSPSMKAIIEQLTPPPPETPSSTSSGSPASPSTYLRPHLTTPANPVTVVTMIGRAERIGYPINAPELQSVGGSKVVKYGRDVIVPSQRPSGFTKNGVQVNIYSLRWKRSYMLTGYPTIKEDADKWDMKSEGHPQQFV